MPVVERRKAMKGGGFGAETEALEDSGQGTKPLIGLRNQLNNNSLSGSPKDGIQTNPGENEHKENH